MLDCMGGLLFMAPASKPERPVTATHHNVGAFQHECVACGFGNLYFARYCAMCGAKIAGAADPGPRVILARGQAQALAFRVDKTTRIECAAKLTDWSTAIPLSPSLRSVYDPGCTVTWKFEITDTPKLFKTGG